ncbi:hypothetical protein N8310_02510 [Pseudomonadota bacterium]|nr:hypothetical protein [Pseudomonadota bacterium]
MKTDKQALKWKLCKAYFAIIDSSLKESVTFDELIFVSKVKPNDANKIISENNKNYNIFFLKILLSKLDAQTLSEFKIDIAEDTISNTYEKILEGLTLRLESFLPYRKSFKTLSQNQNTKVLNFLKLLENNCSFMSDLLDIVESSQNQSIKMLKSIALNIVFLRAMNIFLKENDHNLDSTIRNLDKFLRDFEDVGYFIGVIKN